MTITKTQNGDMLTLHLEGRLDTATSPQLESELTASLPSIKTLTLELSKLSYISSAGLRVLLAAQKAMNAQGQMTVLSPTEEVREVFDVTGFSDILTIE